MTNDKYDTIELMNIQKILDKKLIDICNCNKTIEAKGEKEVYKRNV